jgi:hypothetical protein
MQTMSGVIDLAIPFCILHAAFRGEADICGTIAQLRGGS